MANEMIANRYIIVKLIGSGGMADVFLAIDSILKREVAIKVLRGELANDSVNIERFKREAMAITSTSHPNIVEVFDVGEDNGKNYIVMEYVHGKTLKQLIRQRGVIPVDEAVNIMKQLVSATAHAHKNGIIHRDIKSQNVLVKDDGTVKLSDFGIAYTAEAQQITQTQTVMGSVHYLAPELCMGEICTPQSDVYSLGIVFYEMLKGDVPYHGETAVEIALKHMHNDVPQIRDFNPTIPQSVENIIIRATARNKNLRYNSANMMYSDIVTCLDFVRSDEEVINLEDLQESDKNGKKSSTRSNSKKANKTDKLIASIVVVGIVVCLLVGVLVTITSKMNKKVVVPLVENYKLEDVEDILENRGLEIENINYQATDNVEKGIVLSIYPTSGTEVKPGTKVVLTVSLGTNFRVSNYLGMNIEEVKPMLEAAGFTITVSEVEDSKHAKGTITNQDVVPNFIFSPTDNRAIRFEVATYVSFMIPGNIIGKNIEEAKSILENMGAVVTLSQLPTEENLDENGELIKPSNTVIKASPAVNTYYTQTPGVSITLYYY